MIGPIAEARDTVDALRDDGCDAAVMNITLNGQKPFDLADELAQQKIPFMFMTGFPAKALPDRFRNVKVREKPCVARDVALDVARLCGRLGGTAITRKLECRGKRSESPC